MSLITDISNYQHLKSMSSYDSQQNKYSSVSNKAQPEWQRNALRICGNWSEQLSSKGKVYFYNSLTEVSQWQKPQEWSLPDIDKRDLVKVIDEKRDSGQKRSFNMSTAVSQIPSKVHRLDHESDRYSSSGERKSRNGRPYDDMEISPHSSPQNRDNLDRHRRLPNDKVAPKSTYPEKQPTTLKKLVDVLESLDNLLANKSLRSSQNINGAGVSSCSPISSTNKSLNENKTIPPPPPPPKSTQPRLSESTNGSNKNPKNVSALANTLNSLVTLLNQKGNNSRRQSTSSSQKPMTFNNNNVSHVTPNSTPKSSRDVHQNHHSSPFTAAKSYSNYQRTNSNGGGVHSPNRNFSPVFSNNNHHHNQINQNTLHNKNNETANYPEEDGHQSTAASYRDHRLQKQRSANTDQFNPRSESDQINPNNIGDSLNNPSHNNSVMGNGAISSNGDTSYLSVPKCPEDIPVEEGDVRYKLFQQINSILYSPSMVSHVDTNLTGKYIDKQFTCINSEANSEAKKFDQLHNYLYCELSCEMKKLRSLLLFSEAKLNCHEKKRESLTKLVEELESRKPLTNKSFYV